MAKKTNSEGEDFTNKLLTALSKPGRLDFILDAVKTPQARIFGLLSAAAWTAGLNGIDQATFLRIAGQSYATMNARRMAGHAQPGPGPGSGPQR